MSHQQNIERCEKFKKILITWLHNNNIWCENTKYPNLILIRGMSLKVICPDTKNPMFLAEDADKKQADLYVGFYYENERVLVRFAYQSDFEFYPADPGAGWKNPTHRVHIEQLQGMSVLLSVVQSNGGIYV